jgi:hypothetical protein
MPNKTTSNTVIVEIIEDAKPIPRLPIKIVDIAINNGNLPLHGVKLLVKIARSLSLGESIILAPITPAALHRVDYFSTVYHRGQQIFPPKKIWVPDGR